MYTHVMLLKIILIFLVVVKFSISIPGPLNTKPKEQCKTQSLDGFTADAINRSPFIHAVQRHQRNTVAGT